MNHLPGPGSIVLEGEQDGTLYKGSQHPAPSYSLVPSSNNSTAIVAAKATAATTAKTARVTKTLSRQPTHTLHTTRQNLSPPLHRAFYEPGRTTKGGTIIEHQSNTTAPHVPTIGAGHLPRQNRLGTLTADNNRPQGEHISATVTLLRGGGVKEHSLPPVIFQSPNGETEPTTTRDLRRPSVPHVPKRMAWTTTPPTVDSDLFGAQVHVQLTGVNGAYAIRLGHILGQITFLGHALSAHMLAPSTHRLQAVGGINMQDYAAMPNGAEPNSGVIRQIVMEQMPLTLTFARIGQHPLTTPTAARAWLDGGARRKSDLAAIGFHAAINSPTDPFHSMNATAPPVREGFTVFEGYYRLPVAFRNEVDNVEAELTALCMLLLRLLQHQLYEVDVYTDCAVLLEYADHTEPLPLRHPFHELAKRARFLMAQARSLGGIFVLRHVLRRYNKRADSLCNKAMDDPSTPFLQRIQLYEPPPTTATALLVTQQEQSLPDSDPMITSPPNVLEHISIALQQVLEFVATIPIHELSFLEISTFRRIPSKALKAVAQCFHFVLNNLQIRPFQRGDSFDYESWYKALTNASQGTAPGPDGARVDLVQQLAVKDEELARKFFGRDLAIAHGALGQLSHPLPSPAAHREDCFARLLHLLPVLLTANPISDKMTARAVSDMIMKNCLLFRQFQVKELYERHLYDAKANIARRQKLALRQRGTERGIRARTPEGELLLTEEEIGAIHHHISSGKVGKAAASLKEQVVVISKQRCDKASPDGTLWNKVLRKANALHPAPRHQLTTEFFQSTHVSGDWVTVLSPQMQQIHFASKGILFFKGDDEQWLKIETNHREASDDWTVRPIAVGTCRHRCIARAQVRHNRPSRAAHFRAHGQMAVGTNSGLEMLVHHHHLYTDKFPENVAQSQDGSNAYNEMETVSIAEGILTAPASHHSIYNYFFFSSGQASNVYIAGHTTDNGEKTSAYRFKKGCKQGSPDATDLYCYGALTVTRIMKAELCQHPANYGYLTPLRETAAISATAMAYATPLGSDRPLCPPSELDTKDCAQRIVPFEPSLRNDTEATNEVSKAAHSSCQESNADMLSTSHSTVEDRQVAPAAISNITIGAATDDTITHAPPLASSLAYYWLYHNGPGKGYFLNMVKTITLLPEVAEEQLVPLQSSHRNRTMFSPPPTYTEMRQVCEQYEISPATYELFEQQVYNIQRQSTRLNKWVVLTADLTLTELALSN